IVSAYEAGSGCRMTGDNRADAARGGRRRRCPSPARQAAHRAVMNHSPLNAISPIDGRYADKAAELRPLFSERGLIRQRVRVESLWLRALCAEPAITELHGLPP